MVLIQKKCETLLEEYKEEVRRNPEAACEPYAKRFASEIGELEKAYEKGVISTLFLNLYGLEAGWLWGDLYRFEERGIENPERIRTDLLRSLYGAISVYAGGEDFSTIIQRYRQVGGKKNQSAENKRKAAQYRSIMERFRNAVRENPYVDNTLYIRDLMLAAGVGRMKEACEERIISTLFLYLYGRDAGVLGRDLTKIGTLHVAKTAALHEQTVLLQLLYAALAPYIRGDFSGILEMCGKVDRIVYL